ncbi:hypothetical protein R5N97_04370 [Tenacibaculum maritimum]|uniref:hypothetical protein n=1 Tax=Tenacibaculum maritimum TaxID=107401 RepID=UPI00388DBDF1
MKKLFVIFNLLLISHFLVVSKTFAQVNEAEEVPRVQILARAQKGKILLRWAANSAIAWKKTNKSGFVLEKYLLSRNGKRLPKLEKIWEKNRESSIRNLARNSRKR